MEIVYLILLLAVVLVVALVISKTPMRRTLGVSNRRRNGREVRNRNTRELDYMVANKYALEREVENKIRKYTS